MALPPKIPRPITRHQQQQRHNAVKTSAYPCAAVVRAPHVGVHERDIRVSPPASVRVCYTLS